MQIFDRLSEKEVEGIRRREGTERKGSGKEQDIAHLRQRAPSPLHCWLHC
jgi:hypothetical protein